MIAIIPTESENDTQTNDSTSKNIPTVLSSKHMHNADITKSSDIHNLNNEGIYIFKYKIFKQKFKFIYCETLK